MTHCDALQHAFGMTVGGIDDDDIDAGFGQQLDAQFGALAHADSGADAQATRFVLAGIRMFGGLLDVLDGDQALELESIIDHQHALKTVLVHQQLGPLRIGAFAHGNQALSRRHDGADRLVQIGFETQVAVGDDAHHALAFDNRQAGKACACASG